MSNIASLDWYEDPEKSSSLSSGTEKSSKLAPSGAFLLSGSSHGVKNGVSFDQYLKFNMAKKKLYKDPKIIRCKNGDWYVEYYFRDPQTLKWEPFKERRGINYIKDLDAKEAAAEELRSLLLSWLKEGNTPFLEEQIMEADIVEKKVEVKKKKEAEIKKGWSLAKAISEFLVFITKQGYSDNTIRTYRTKTNVFSKWLIDNDLQDREMCGFTEIEVQVYLDEMDDSEGWSPRTFNNYRDFAITFFNQAQKLEKKATKNRKLIYDFIPDDLDSKIVNPQRNKAFTPKQLKELKTQLSDREDYNLKDYLEWIFLGFMRPAEIRKLKVENIDEVARQIRIKGKEGDRIVPISDQMMRILQRRKVLSASLSSYVFGYAGNVDERRMSVAYFLTRFEPIKTAMNLDENYGPYSMKPTGVIAMIMAGFSDKEIMTQTGHKTEKAFAAYKRDLIVDNSHVMKGSTIEF